MFFRVEDLHKKERLFLIISVLKAVEGIAVK